MKLIHSLKFAKSLEAESVHVMNCIKQTNENIFTYPSLETIPKPSLFFRIFIGQRVKVSGLMGINFDEKIQFLKFFLQELIFDIIQVSSRLNRDR